MPSDNLEWNVSQIAKLTRLWLARNPDGSYVHSGAAIGRIFGVSKNAAVGKAHRIGLPARPSPLGDGSKNYRKPGGKKRTPKETLPPLASVTSPHAPTRSRAPRVGKAARAAPAKPPAPPPAEPLPARAGPVRPCCWPIGDPGTPGFRFCDSVSMRGRPYCEEHVRDAYVRVHDRRETAA